LDFASDSKTAISFFKTAGIDRFPTPPFSIASSIPTDAFFDDNPRSATITAMRNRQPRHHLFRLERDSSVPTWSKNVKIEA
jgi:hypothetical protein